MPLVVRPILRIASLVFGSILCVAAAPAQIAAPPPQFPPLPQFPPPPRFPILPQLSSLPMSQHKYDLVLSGGHVLDPKNHRDGIMDIAIKDGKIVDVAPHIASPDTIKTVSLRGLYLTPGLIDIHVHAYAGTGEKGSYAGDNSVYPDGFTFRNGVTTVVDAGSSGWRNFEDFKQRVIDRSDTRVLAFLNIVGAGMRGELYENNNDDMDGHATAAMLDEIPERAGGDQECALFRTWLEAVRTSCARGKHCQSSSHDRLRHQRDGAPAAHVTVANLTAGRYLHPYVLRASAVSRTCKHWGRARRCLSDANGVSTSTWATAAAVSTGASTEPLMKDGFQPDSISTDLHITSMNAGMKDLLNVADKMLALGQTVPQVFEEMTSAPAHDSSS